MLTGVAGGMMFGLPIRVVSNLEAYKRILVCSIYLRQMVADILTCRKGDVELGYKMCCEGCGRLLVDGEKGANSGYVGCDGAMKVSGDKAGVDVVRESG